MNNWNVRHVSATHPKATSDADIPLRAPRATSDKDVPLSAPKRKSKRTARKIGKDPEAKQKRIREMASELGVEVEFKNGWVIFYTEEGVVNCSGYQKGYLWLYRKLKQG